MDHLRHNIPIHKICIDELAITYCNAIFNIFIFILNDRVVYLEPVTVSTNHICRIIIPSSYRRIMFIAMHTSPATSHVGEYKMLYRVKLRLFWPRMKIDIKNWQSSFLIAC